MMNSKAYEEVLATYEEITQRKLIPAATVILLRDGVGGGGNKSEGELEVLMVRRNPELEFVGGSWVFPGGKVDKEDYEDKDIMTASLNAAVREVEEEIGLKLEHDQLVRFSHWVPPPILPKLFATWFFIAPIPEGEIKVDGSEICDYQWLTPRQAIQKRDANEMEIAPPTFMTLNELMQYSSIDEALTTFTQKAELPFYATRIVNTETATIALWEGDAGYENLDPHAEGSRHRLEISRKIWELESTL